MMKRSSDGPLPGFFASLVLLIWASFILIIPWRKVRWALIILAGAWLTIKLIKQFS